MQTSTFQYRLWSCMLENFPYTVQENADVKFLADKHLCINDSNEYKPQSLITTKSCVCTIQSHKIWTDPGPLGQTA